MGKRILDETWVECSFHFNKQSPECNKICKLYFDVAYCRERNGVGVSLVSLEGNLIPISFKLELKATNNVVECEALFLGLKATKNFKIGCLEVFGDSKLVVKKIRNQCQTKNPILKAYQNEAWHLIKKFFISFNIQFFPRDRNRMVESLAVDANNFNRLQTPSSDMKSRLGTDL